MKKPDVVVGQGIAQPAELGVLCEVQSWGAVLLVRY